ncbi:TRAP transporter small permease [Jannaschia seohaensis]|uniref:TRAP transporter small permease protein n=1 Tax=Jannaschia seohaensis TaxID=475081 RepID=A0A2Y9C961_9RHOB|nr:TRAP transporter small permease [Jannaschia seohaensis]PWJ11172.1 TRAP-type C4-dicarboxylate transport system permease small subunit [Jannaschia seohaensis]SSA51473.1 TRAP-type C4-dicarboxylate transport system, small permease component [Jannaschia seohaensis]
MSLLETGRRRLETAATVAALMGGIALSATALFTFGAVIADAFGAPVLGDSEVVELVVGASIATFLPLCQIKNGHVAITMLTDPLPRVLRESADVMAAALMLVVAFLLTWRMGIGGLDAFERERATMFLRLPLWWGYLGAFMPCLLWVVAAAFVLLERLARLRGHRTIDPEGQP